MDNVDMVSTDVLIVGGGPSGLSAAIRLADKLKEKGEDKRVMLIEKGSSIGSHILSGAVIKPDALKELLSDEEFEGVPFDSKVQYDDTVRLSEEGSITLPFHPPYMNNNGNYIASLGQICKYLATVAESKGVEIYPGFAVDELLYEKGKVVGVKTKDTGVDHHGNKLKNYQRGTSVKADIVILAEGTRGSLAKQLISKFDLDSGKNAQIYSLGVKELWSVPEGNIEEGRVYHTFGHPLDENENFGGGFIYGMTGNRVGLGLVVGLDYKDPTFDPQVAMQVWKTHPFVSKILKGGKIIEFGAKTLPEGGYYAIPKLYDDNVMIVGDSAGMVAMPALKGVHLAVTSGMLAAETAVVALIKEDTSAQRLSSYEEAVKQSRINDELYPVRNFRQAFTKGMISGVFQFATQLVTGGAGLFGRLEAEPDNETLVTPGEYPRMLFKDRVAKKLEYDKVLTFDKVTDVFYSKAMHDEEQPVHLVINDQEQFDAINIEKYGMPCQYFCPAEVYELHVDKTGHKELRIHAENCVHCKTCDIKSPNNAITWTAPYGGDGPEYENM
jgi:electron-transferring-flavoprotein dehydrogenase